MAFQPFGYLFEIKSSYSPAEVKAAIRAHKKGWLDPANGARGWIVGPFICLWFSAFDRHGPMLFGLISNDLSGTRLRGRAGADLNGVVMASLLIPLLAFTSFKMIADAAQSLRQSLVFAAVLLVSYPLIYWMAHKDRRQAEPLVRFIRDAATCSGQALRKKSAAVPISKGLTLSIGGKKLPGEPNAGMIYDALTGVGSESFVILESSPQTYIQTASTDGRYIVEKREGDSGQHFRAIHQNDNSAISANDDETFEFEEVTEIFLTYASSASTPPFMTWQRTRLTH